MAELRVQNLTKRFNDVAALENASFQAADGELLVILGPTGAGKTTSLRVIAGLEPIDSGTVFLGGVDITRETPARRDVAVIFQNFSLYPHLSVGENLAFPLRAKWRQISEQVIRERVQFAAKLLHIESMLDRKPSLLSGGQMQRVAIGRALVRQPRLFLMDEPLTNLDAKLREELRFELKALQRELKTTTVYVTHDPVEAMSLADRLVVLDNGRVLQDDKPDRVYARPAHRRVGDLLGTPPMNFLDGSISNGHAVLAQAPKVGWLLDAIGNSAAAGKVLIGIRPEDILIDPQGVIEAECEIVEFFGADVIAMLKVGDARFRTILPDHIDLRAGQKYRVSVKPEAIHLFHLSGSRLS